MSTITLFFDGASRGNPGPAGAGAYLTYPDGTKELSKPLGIATNNQAEYRALILGLKDLVDNFNHPEVTRVIIKGDSQLIIKQLKGEWRVKSANIRPDYTQAVELIKTLRSRDIEVNLNYVPREDNQEADRLANEGADQNSRKQ